MQRLVDAAPFGRWWGLLVESVGVGSASVRLPYRHVLERPGGVLHGGCSTVVADVAVWIAIMSIVEGGEHALTVHLATDYISRANGDIVGTARLIKVGRRLAMGSVETRSDDGTLVATHQVTYALPSAEMTAKPMTHPER
jgi:uncharacterized protein (TIGR00369 family)